MYKLVDGIQSNKIRDTLLRKGADVTLKKAIDVCRADETTDHEMKIIKQEINVDALQRNRRRSNNDNREKNATHSSSSNISNNEQPEEMQILWKATLPEAMSSIWSNMQKMWEKESLTKLLQCKKN